MPPPRLPKLESTPGLAPLNSAAPKGRSLSLGGSLLGGSISGPRCCGLRVIALLRGWRVGASIKSGSGYS